mgnify:CR=1 FL=1
MITFFVYRTKEKDAKTGLHRYICARSTGYGLQLSAPGWDLNTEQVLSNLKKFGVLEDAKGYADTIQFVYINHQKTLTLADFEIVKLEVSVNIITN